jgi:hypothetical protein
MRGVLGLAKPLLPSGLPLLLCAKGIETDHCGPCRTAARSADLRPRSVGAELRRGGPRSTDRRDVASRDVALTETFTAALGTRGSGYALRPGRGRWRRRQECAGDCLRDRRGPRAGR